jgi:hypothetical protein
MGDADPQVARQVSPNSLRALYGINGEQNAVMGSLDVESAEIQIASLFVSSPPFPTTDLPPEDFSTNGDERVLTTDSLQSLSVSSLRSSSNHPFPLSASTSTNGTGHSPAHSSSLNTSATSSRRTSFKAREIPPSHASPTIVPRTTRAAALRAGVTLPKVERGHAPRTPPSKEAMQKMFADVPGHKRTESIPVASTLAPTMAPRMTRAASLRISGAPPPKPRPKPIITIAQAKAKAAEEQRAKEALKEAQARTFEGVPGHKRRESISVSSTKTPTISPRPNRSAQLRASKDATPPSSYQCTLSFRHCFFCVDITFIIVYTCSPAADWTISVAVHQLAGSSLIRARRLRLSASIAISNVRWRCHLHSSWGSPR